MEMQRQKRKSPSTGHDSKDERHRETHTTRRTVR